MAVSPYMAGGGGGSTSHFLRVEPRRAAPGCAKYPHDGGATYQPPVSVGLPRYAPTSVTRHGCQRPLLPLNRGAATRGGLGVPSSSMAPMPKPGEPCPGFTAEPDRCWRMLYDRTSRRRTAARRRSGRVGGSRREVTVGSAVWACPDHLEGLTGLREFGSRREP
jgi:hypothetical protein